LLCDQSTLKTKQRYSEAIFIAKMFVFFPQLNKTSPIQLHTKAQGLTKLGNLKITFLAILKASRLIIYAWRGGPYRGKRQPAKNHC